MLDNHFLLCFPTFLSQMSLGVHRLFLPHTHTEWSDAVASSLSAANSVNAEMGPAVIAENPLSKQVLSCLHSMLKVSEMQNTGENGFFMPLILF